MVELTGNKSRFITDQAIEFPGYSFPKASRFSLNIGYIATHSPYRQQAHDPLQTARYQDCPFAADPALGPASHGSRTKAAGNELK